ncbi:MAG: hypothetical protein AB7H66_03790 [Hyphomonadaceae bacterium]
MARKWTLGALTAVIVAVVVAMQFPPGSAWQASLSLSPLAVELSVSDHPARIVLAF